MKRIFWWSVFGIAGAGLPALWLGQSVMGQPDTRTPAPMMTSQPIVPAKKNAGGKPASDLPRMVELTGAQLTDLQSTPILPAPAAGQTPTAPALPKLQPLPTGPTPVVPAPKMQPLPTGPSPLIAPPPPSHPLLPVGPVAPALISGKLESTGTAPEASPGKQQPSVSLEWVAPSATRIHQPMPCQILVKNTSSVPVHNVVVRHRVGQGVVCKSSEPKVAQDAGELIWTLGTLAPDQTRRIDLVLVSQARGTLNCQATATFTAVAGHHVQVREPMLAIKMRIPEKVVAGENVNVLVVVTNPGDGVAEGVKLKTVLPEGLEHSSGRRTIEFDVGELQPKETKSMQLPCTAKGSGVQNCAIVASGDGNLTANDAAQIDVLVAKLDVALAGPKLRYLDRRAVYVLKVTNPGSAPATSVEVQELIPSGFKFAQANHGGQFQEATRLVTWSLGDLQPGQTKEISVDLVPIETGDHRLSAYAKSARGLKSEAEMRTVVEGLPSLFIEVSHVDDPIEVGAETAYEIRVANTGTKLETNVEVVCTLPEQLEFKGAKCTSTLKYRQEGRDLIFEPLPKLAPKADVIYRVQVKGIAPGDIRFRTKIRADGLSEPLLREESTRIYSDEAPLGKSPAKTAPGELPPLRPSVPGVDTKPGDNPGGPFPLPTAPSTPLPVPGSVTPPLPTPIGPTPTPMFPPISGPMSVPTPVAPAPAPLPIPVQSEPALPPISR